MDEKLNIETTPEKEDISHIPNSMFDQNIAYEQPKPEGREYFEAFHKGELNPLSDSIVMTRSQYIKDVARIEQNTEKEIKDAVKYIPIYALIVVALFVLTVAINTVCHNIGLEPLVRLSGGVSAAALMILPATIFFFASSTVKKIKKAKKANEKALKTLEMRKQECMILGTYDTSK